MVLTDRQRIDLHAAIYEYLNSRSGEAFQKAADAMKEADPAACERHSGGVVATTAAANGTANDSNSSRTKSAATPLLEKKWTAVTRLSKKVLELERQVAQSAKIHAHRTGVDGGGGAGEGQRRMLPRLPATHTLAGHTLVVTCCAVHPVFTVAVSGSEDGTIKVWDHESGDYIRTLKGHTNTVNSVSFSPTGTHLVSCSTDLSIKLWDVSTYACLRTLRGHDHTISAVVFLPKPGLTSGGGSETKNGIDPAVAGSQHVLSASRDATVKLWDVETGFCDYTFSDHSDWVRALAVRQSDGSLWASSGNDQVIYVYDSATKQKVVELRGHEHVVEAVAFVTEQALKSGTAQRQTKHTETVRDYLASGSRDRTVRLWKISEASCIATFKAHENWVRGVVIHPSGNYVISCADDKSIRVFDVKNKRCLRTLENAHDHFVTSLDIHHTLPILVSGSVDTTVRCWQLQ